MRFELDVVCTDNGRHKRTRLTRIKIHDDGGGEWRAGGSFHPPDNLEGVEPLRNPARIDGRPNEIFLADCPRGAVTRAALSALASAEYVDSEEDPARWGARAFAACPTGLLPLSARRSGP